VREAVCSREFACALRVSRMRPSGLTRAPPAKSHP
jgi:hypothetical protein